MKILHSISTVNPAAGGPIQGILLHNKAAAPLGIVQKRHIVSLDTPDASFLRDFPLEVSAVGDHHSNNIIGKALRHYYYSSKYIGWLRENAPAYDAVIVHGLWNYASSGASLVLPKLSVPYFVFVHGMMDPWFKRAYPAKHVLKSLFWLLAEGRLAKDARCLLFTTEEERRLARTLFPGAKYNDAVVPYGCLPAEQSPKTGPDNFFLSFPAISGKRFLLYLSRIHEKKGADLLLHGLASSKLPPDLDLVMAGPGDESYINKLKKIIAGSPLEHRVHWTGPLYGDSKWAALRAAEALILPSHQENFGIAVAESLACGTPVLISDKVNIFREICDAEAGLVEEDSIAGVTRLLERWCSLPISTRNAMSASATKLFTEKFDVYNTAGKYLKILSDHI